MGKNVTSHLSNCKIHGPRAIRAPEFHNITTSNSVRTMRKADGNDGYLKGMRLTVGILTPVIRGW
jgi:hypothetical protein